MMNYLLDSTMIRKWIVQDASIMKKTMYIFQRLIEKHLNPVFENMTKHGVEPGYYASPWFITLFCSKVDINISVKVIDLLFIDGFASIFRIAMSIIALKQDELTTASFEEMLLSLNCDLRDIDKTELFSQYLKIVITPTEIAKINEEYYKNPDKELITM